RVVVGVDRRGRDRARRDVHAAAHLRGAARGARPGRRGRGDGRPARRARARRPARRLPARAVGLAGGNQPPLVRRRRAERRRPGAVQVIHAPHVDWFALSTVLALLGASGVALLGAVLVPRPARRAFAATVAALGFTGGIVASVWLYAASASGHRVVANAF